LLITITMNSIIRNFSNGPNYASDLLIPDDRKRVYILPEMC